MQHPSQFMDFERSLNVTGTLVLRYFSMSNVSVSVSLVSDFQNVLEVIVVLDIFILCIRSGRRGAFCTDTY